MPCINLANQKDAQFFTLIVSTSLIDISKDELIWTPLLGHNKEHSAKRVNATLNSSSSWFDLHRISANFSLCLPLYIISNLLKYPLTSCMSPFAFTGNPSSAIPIVYPKLSGLSSNSLPALSTNHSHSFYWSWPHFISINLPNPIRHTHILCSAVNLDAIEANTSWRKTLFLSIELSIFLISANILAFFSSGRFFNVLLIFFLTNTIQTYSYYLLLFLHLSFPPSSSHSSPSTHRVLRFRFVGPIILETSASHVTILIFFLISS